MIFRATTQKILITVVLVAGLIAGAFWVIASPCGSIGNDGCEAALHLRDIVVTGDAMVVDGGGRLRVAGVHYRDGPRNRLNAAMVVVRLDPETGEEIDRLDVGYEGMPDQLRLSPIGEGFAISCNAVYVCDLPGGDRPRETEAAQFDKAGKLSWATGIAYDVAPPDSEGRAFELGYSASGQVLFAHVAHLVETGEVILTRQQMLESPSGVLAAADGEAHGGLAQKLDLPPDFIPFLRHRTAISPDGMRIAVLARRFSGPGRVRAAIRIFDITSGALLARHDIAQDLAPALLWHPRRDAVIVAEAGAVAENAGTSLYFYNAGEGP